MYDCPLPCSFVILELNMHWVANCKLRDWNTVNIELHHGSIFSNVWWFMLHID